PLAVADALATLPSVATALAPAAVAAEPVRPPNAPPPAAPAPLVNRAEDRPPRHGLAGLPRRHHGSHRGAEGAVVPMEEREEPRRRPRRLRVPAPEPPGAGHEGTRLGAAAGAAPTTGLGPVPTHKVTVHDRQTGVVHEFVVPEDQYILHTAEAQDIKLPFACRHGCCTSCAARIKSGQIRQPEALGISAELKDKGYALLCVGFPSGDVEVETQDEDEATT
ncbi:unnamed protein product, partial [Urochloa humidicola]